MLYRIFEEPSLRLAEIVQRALSFPDGHTRPSKKILIISYTTVAYSISSRTELTVSHFHYLLGSRQIFDRIYPHNLTWVVYYERFGRIFHP